MNLPSWLADPLSRILGWGFGPNPFPVPGATEGPIDPAGVDAMVLAINTLRTNRGLPPVFSDDRLTAVAQGWADSIASGVGLSHGDFATRISAIFPNVMAGENIAQGQPDASSVVATWQADGPHMANLVGDFTLIGVGIAKGQGGATYWVADFVAA